MEIEAIDLFCGVGGLTHGLAKAGIKVKLGVDLDPACGYPYTKNNNANFLEKDISEIKGSDLAKCFKPGSVRLLAGCAPCQPFSTLRHGEDTSSDKKWSLLLHFARLISELKPELVTMENVPGVAKHAPFSHFVRVLQKNGYRFESSVVNCADFGLAQDRKRFVLVASRLGPISLPVGSRSKRKTVRQVIGGLPKIAAGEGLTSDSMHKAMALSALNMERVVHSKAGGTWKDWPPHLQLECHKKASGASFKSVYGRMQWDETAPTMTTQCYNLGTGRFIHPDQNRAISLREAAMLQSFPKSYKFSKNAEDCSFKVVGRLIGNAVPPVLGKALGQTFLAHINSFKGIV